MNTNIHTGLLITVEGIDGAGKSTLVKSIQKILEDQNKKVLCTKEPGATELGHHIRALLQHRTQPICPKAEYLLFAADRAQHFEHIVIPALKNHHIVISDRMGDSSLVYQGYARGLSLDMIERINTWTMQSINPDITFYLRITAEESIKRTQARNIPLTSFEKEHVTFTQALVNGFDILFKKKSWCITLDGMLSIDDLTTQAINHIQLCIQKKLQIQQHIQPQSLLHTCS